MEKGAGESRGGDTSAPGEELDPGPELCIGQTASMFHLIFKTTLPRSIITIFLTKPFQGSERGSDLPRVTQLEALSLPVGFTCLQIPSPSRSLHCGTPG